MDKIQMTEEEFNEMLRHTITAELYFKWVENARLEKPIFKNSKYYKKTKFELAEEKYNSLLKTNPDENRLYEIIELVDFYRDIVLELNTFAENMLKEEPPQEIN